MDNPISIILYGQLRLRSSAIKETIFFGATEPVAVSYVLEKIGIPRDSVQLIMVNHKAVTENSTICPGDRVSLFSKEYPVFADWLNRRL